MNATLVKEYEMRLMGDHTAEEYPVYTIYDRSQ